MHRKKTLLAAGLATAALFLTTACSGGSTPTQTSDDNGDAPEMSDVAVALLRTVGSTPVFAAHDDGFDADNGIDFSWEYSESSAATTSLLIGKSVQVAVSSYPGVINSNIQGIPLVIISEGITSSDDFITLEALPDSGIESIEDLVGKTVGVPSLNSSADNKVKETLINLGLDPDSVNFVAIPFAESVGALETNVIDVATLTGPGQADARSRLNTVEVFDLGEGDYDGWAESGFVVTKEFAETNPHTVRAVQCALQSGADFIKSDEDALVSIAAKNLELEESVVRSVPLPGFQTTIRFDELQRNADQMHLLGLIDEPFDMSSITLSTPEDCP